MQTNAITNHPATECLRLMSEAELASLAADIAKHGLREPITLGRVAGADPVLVDGRGRLKACEIAGVEPRFVTLDFADDDAVAHFILSRNVYRAQLTANQHAASAVLSGFEPRPGAAADAMREWLEYCAAREIDPRDDLLRMRDGHLTAYWMVERVREWRKEEAERAAMYARLKADAPDLAVEHDEKRMSLADAIAVLDCRDEGDLQATVAQAQAIQARLRGRRAPDPKRTCAS